MLAAGDKDKAQELALCGCVQYSQTESYYNGTSTLYRFKSGQCGLDTLIVDSLTVQLQRSVVIW
jgi:hypothetical protein